MRLFFSEEKRCPNSICANLLEIIFMTSANLTFFAPTFFKKKEQKNTGLNLRKSKSKIVCKYKVKKKIDGFFFLLKLAK